MRRKAAKRNSGLARDLSLPLTRIMRFHNQRFEFDATGTGNPIMAMLLIDLMSKSSFGCYSNSNYSKDSNYSGDSNYSEDSDYSKDSKDGKEENCKDKQS